MIVSHKHKFIFLKTEKTAGTSIEIALSKFCGPLDIITPISSSDEAKRVALGHRGPQNYLVPANKYNREDIVSSLVSHKRLRFFNHASAKFVKNHLDKDVWGSYFKFSFERNPWDKAISYYYWRSKNNSKISIHDFIQSGGANDIRGFNIYTINSEIIVDRVFMYENLEESMDYITKRLGLSSVPVLPQAKSDVRKDRRHYRETLTSEDRDKIKRVFAREIEYFDFKW